MKNPLTHHNQNLFDSSREKGQREWSMRGVVEDKIDMFAVHSPRKSETPHYPNVLHIKRLPRRLVLKLAH